MKNHQHGEERTAVTNDDALSRYRLRVMAAATELGNVRAADVQGDQDHRHQGDGDAQDREDLDRREVPGDRDLRDGGHRPTLALQGIAHPRARGTREDARLGPGPVESGGTAVERLARRRRWC